VVLYIKLEPAKSDICDINETPLAKEKSHGSIADNEKGMHKTKWDRLCEKVSYGWFKLPTLTNHISSSFQPNTFTCIQQNNSGMDTISRLDHIHKSSYGFPNMCSYKTPFCRAGHKWWIFLPSSFTLFKACVYLHHTWDIIHLYRKQVKVKH